MAKLPSQINPKIRKVALAISPGDIVALYDYYRGEVPFEIFTVEKLTATGFFYGLVYPPTRKGWRETVDEKWNTLEWEIIDDDENVVYTSAIPELAREMIKAIFKYIGS